MKSENDYESGECTEDETFTNIEIPLPKIKKKKQKKSSKKKRKRSSSHSNNCIEYFDPYIINNDDLNIKTENTETFDDISTINESDITSDAVIANTFKNLEPLPQETVESSDMSKVVEVPKVKVVKIRIQRIIDSMGIDGCTDLRSLLRSMNFDMVLIENFMELMDREENENENGIENEYGVESEDGSENFDMLDDIPMVDESKENHRSYSPEPVKKSHISYAPRKLNTLGLIIDAQSIPPVSPTDPRLVNSKLLSNVNTIPNVILQPSKSDVSNQKKWKTEVIKTVEKFLKEYLIQNKINKNEYNSIFKRATSKIIDSGEHKLDYERIKSFVKSYVNLTVRPA